MKIDPTLHAIVTGAAGGLGRCFARELVAHGAAVAACDVDEDGLDALEEALEGLPGRLLPLRVDITDEGAVRTFVQTAASRLGGLNVLVNNAGILRDGKLIQQEDGWVRRLPTAQWKAVLDVNLTGQFYMAREFAASVVEHRIRPGLIVNISSITSAGNAGQSNYAAAKAGLDADTRTWALELADVGIRVAGIAPGMVDTPMLSSMDAAHQQALLERIPLRRIGHPTEIWRALRFVLECDYFNGRTLSVDGGADF